MASKSLDHNVFQNVFHENQDDGEPNTNETFNFSNYLRSKLNSKIHKSIAFAMSIILIITLIILSKTLQNLFDGMDDGVSMKNLLNLRLYTHNIRNDNPNPDGERFWLERKKLVTSSIRFHTENTGSSVIGLQEVLYNQLEDILEILNLGQDENDWTYYGVGREDGIKKGEFAPILYKKSQWELVESRTFWLSETPDIPSVGWDSALERIVTMVTLEFKKNPTFIINVFCTHFDHIGVIGRRESAKLIMDRMENYNDYPSFLLGDFNTQPTDEPYHILKSHGIKDSRTLATELQSYGHTGTFTGFDINNEVNTIIDYIWAPSWSTNGSTIESSATSTVATPLFPNPDQNGVKFQEISPKTSIILRSYGVLQSYFGYYLSDHRPVVALYELKQ